MLWSNLKVNPKGGEVKWNGLDSFLSTFWKSFFQSVQSVLMNVLFQQRIFRAGI